MWAKIMRERFEATDERTMKIRFHTQTGGVTLQAQQPEVNIVRVALQGSPRCRAGRSRCTTGSTRRWLYRRSARRGSPCARSRFSRTSRGRGQRRSVRRLVLHRSPDRRDRGARVGADGEGRAARGARSTRSSSSSARSRSRRSPITSATAKARTSSSGSTSTSPRPRTTSRCSRSTRSRAPPARAAGGVQVESRPGTGRRAPRESARGGEQGRKPALPDQGRTPRRRVDRRGLRRDARRVRRVPRGAFF